ncbi:Protein TBATA [Dissostichus eleginoides]|uniref:Protein TBATA n=1 Tax=Dissostichus eleginoides TaxID=100907 RepID=A0AAD9EU81_DISEL|nr:Protein TBATA [Dissostichus eleginoides]
MSMAQRTDSCGTTGERSRSQTNQLSFTPEFTKMLTKSSLHFGALSQHSFFSRHNPHPHRVRHIQGLNGRPVCMVRDDWFVTSSLFPHPLLKSHVFKKATGPSLDFPLAHKLNGVSSNKIKSAQFSEAGGMNLKTLLQKSACLPKREKTKNLRKNLSAERPNIQLKPGELSLHPLTLTNAEPIPSA